MHILQDSHQSNLRLENSRKAMIHIMSDLKETSEEVKRREQELREKQEQLVQAGKLATLGELTTGVAHELNNPLNNIGLFMGNAIDLIELGMADTEPRADSARTLQCDAAGAQSDRNYLASAHLWPRGLGQLRAGGISQVVQQLHLAYAGAATSSPD